LYHKEDSFIEKPLKNAKDLYRAATFFEICFAIISMMKPPQELLECYYFLPKVRGYKFEEFLGKGGFGSTGKYSSDFDAGAYFAIKFLKLNTQEKITDGRQEVEIFSEISRRRDFPKGSIIELKDAYVDENILIMIMEFAAKGDLFNELKFRREKNMAYSFEELCEHFINLAKGLYFLHSGKPQFIHRDIKPQNILITEEKKLKIGDFGSVKRTFKKNLTAGEEFIKSNTYIGSESYLPPEIVKPPYEYNEKVDIWALGLVFYEMVTLKRILKRPSNESELDFSSMAMYKPEEIRLLEEIIKGMVCIEKEKRFSAGSIISRMSILNSSCAIPLNIFQTKGAEEIEW